MTHDEAMKKIDELVKQNDIVLFMKGTPEFPMCGFSGRVTQILKHFRRNFVGVNVLEDESIRSAIKTYTNWPTIPQLYIKGTFVGGCDITTEMAQTGELEKLLNEQLGPAN